MGKKIKEKGKKIKDKGKGRVVEQKGKMGEKLKREEKIKKVKGNEISVKTKEAVFSMILFELSA